MPHSRVAPAPASNESVEMLSCLDAPYFSRRFTTSKCSSIVVIFGRKGILHSLLVTQNNGYLVQVHWLP